LSGFSIGGGAVADWHVVFTRIGAERRAASDLCTVAPGTVDGFCPSARASYWRRGRVISQAIPLIARICFGRWETADPHAWHAVRRTIGVVGILNEPAGGERPRVVRDRNFENWWRTCDDGWIVPAASLKLSELKRGFAAGDQCLVSYRALQNVLAEVLRIDEMRQTALVEFNIVGRPQLRMFPLSAIRPVNGHREMYL
jgi:hypothetical protein